MENRLDFCAVFGYSAKHKEEDELRKTHIRTARKFHHCDACGEEIFPGQSYTAEIHTDSGKLSTRKQHLSPVCEHAGAKLAEEAPEYPDNVWQSLEEHPETPRKLLWSQCRTLRHSHAWIPDCYECGQRIEWLDQYIREVWRIGRRLVSYYRHVHCPWPDDDEYLRELEEENEETNTDWEDEEWPLAA